MMMRTTVTLDDDLIEEAARATGIEGRTELLREGLKVLIEREAYRRLAALGGTMPNLQPTPRRRSAAPR
jgi:Arc/MetJ family transcription regulator